MEIHKSSKIAILYIFHETCLLRLSPVVDPVAHLSLLQLFKKKKRKDDHKFHESLGLPDKFLDLLLNLSCIIGMKGSYVVVHWWYES